MLEIEHDIPIPPSKRFFPRGDLRLKLQQLGLKDSIFVPLNGTRTIRQLQWNVHKAGWIVAREQHKQFTTRRIREPIVGIRIWRIA